MEVEKFMNKNKNMPYDELKFLLEKEYKLKINEDKNNNYYMISYTDESDHEKIFIRQCSGIILEKGTNNILHYFGERAYINYNLTEIKKKNILLL